MTERTHAEYLRRNLIHCSSIGVRVGLSRVIDRLAATKRPPRWLMDELRGLLDRAGKLPPELAAWRNQADDRP